MSWLARSIANSLRIDDDDDLHRRTAAGGDEHTEEEGQDEEEEEQDRLDNQQRGVKEDLSEFRETLTRQIWGVASFLAPPPNQQSDRSICDRNSTGDSGPEDNSDEETSDFVRYSGFLSESEKYRSGFSDLAHSLPFRLEDQIGGAVGITEESLAFASNIAHHPETWLDFPLSEEEDLDDFDMSDAQCKHATAVERLAPRLAALRIELCPAHMSKGYFWKVYFVLLHSRLNKHDAELLSTPQVMAVRAMWMQELQNHTKPESNMFGRSTFYTKESSSSQFEDFDPTKYDFPKYTSHGTSAFEHATYSPTTEFETEKHPVVSSESQSIDKSVIQEEPVIKIWEKEIVAGPSYTVPVQQYDDDDDDDVDWLEQHSELDGYAGRTIFFGTDEDVSFSDLEDDDDCTMPLISKPPSNDIDMSTKKS